MYPPWPLGSCLGHRFETMGKGWQKVPREEECGGSVPAPVFWGDTTTGTEEPLTE